MSEKRQRMIEDMMVRNFIEKTRNDYIRHVLSLTASPSPFARYRDARRAAPLPTAPDANRRASAEHQCLGGGHSLLLHRHPRPA